MDTVQGWPFLVARGRARGYSVLLAPDFLVARQDYGFLEEVAGPLPDGTPFRTTTVRRDHGDLGVVWSDYPTGVRDEHSRPLRLLAGFACTGTISRPSELDLEAARSAAVATFERFLLDEDGFTVESAAPFPAQSAVTRRTATGTSRSRRLTVPAVLLCAAVAVTLLVLLLTSRRGGTPPPPRTVRPCATTQAAAGQPSCVSTTTVTIRKGHVTP